MLLMVKKNYSLMNIPRLIFSGSGSAVGKTTISSGIMCALSKKGYDVQPFKVGPDYIDCGYHEKATKNPSRTLDSFLMDEDTIAEIFTRNTKDISIIEGVRGLFEGISIEDEIGSTAHISKILHSPVILIVNVRSITKSAAAIVSGFKSFDPNVKISGVILNNISGSSHKQKVVRAVENLSDTEVLGAIPKDDRMEIEQRHLGLHLPHENQDLDATLDDIRAVIEENVNLDRILEIANTSEDFPKTKERLYKKLGENKVKVGVAYDKAFNFYYADSLDLLRLHGCQLHFFSPLNDKNLPDEIDGLYIGGGYPEVFAEELSNNSGMMKHINRAANDDMPIYAECGGLIYLSKRFEGNKMVGFLPCSAKMSKRHLRFTICKTIRKTIIGDKGLTLKGHEFHYTTLKDLPDDTCFSYEMVRGAGIDGKYDGIIQNNTLSSYNHLHFATEPGVVKSLVGSFGKYKRR